MKNSQLSPAQMARFHAVKQQMKEKKARDFQQVVRNLQKKVIIVSK